MIFKSNVNATVNYFKFILSKTEFSRFGIYFYKTIFYKFLTKSPLLIKKIIQNRFYLHVLSRFVE